MRLFVNVTDRQLRFKRKSSQRSSGTCFQQRFFVYVICNAPAVRTSAGFVRGVAVCNVTQCYDFLILIL
jgi:hypothetical protein